ncbi:MAG: Ig domain protein group 1 domain protein [Gemmatimonadetes bacterium]|nr:Ig domain protein group 1 domain protein [Gemmatimonadota bacterium]
MRLSLRLAAAAILAVGLVTCSDSPAAPGKGGAAHLALRPTFSREAAAAWNSMASFGLAVNNVHVVLRDAAGNILKDVVVVFPEGADEISLELEVSLSAPEQQLSANIELRDASGTVLFSGTQLITAKVGSIVGPGDANPPVPITYVGPGAKATVLAIAPRDTAIGPTGTATMRFRTTDNAGTDVVGTPVTFTVRDGTIGSISASGVFSAAGKRGSTIVVAQTPSGLKDSTTVSVVLPATKLVLVSGGGQTGVAGNALAQQVVVEVQAADNVPVAGVAVGFNVVTGGGSIAPVTMITGANGRAQATFTLGKQSGAQSAQVSSGVFAPITVTATATAGTASKLSIVSGNNQQDTLSKALPLPFMVKVTDANDNAVGGVSVSWSKQGGAAGSLSASASNSDASGLASVNYTLGSTARVDTIQATLGGQSVSFLARALSRSAAKITVVAGASQSGPVGTPFPTAFRVKVTDDVNNAVPNSTVTWRVASGAGTLASATSVTDANGEATMTFTPGPVPGAISVGAAISVAGAPVEVTIAATSTVGAASSMTKVAGDGQSGPGGAAYPVAPSVKVTDALGNAISGFPVTFAVTSGGGTVLGGNASTNSSGIATSGAWTPGTSGAQVITATSGPLSVQFSGSVTSVTPASVSLIAHQGFYQAGIPSTVPLVVEVRDAGNNVLPGISVTLGFNGTAPVNVTLGGTLTATTDAAGRASFLGFTLAGPAQSLQLRATAGAASTVYSTSLQAGTASKLVLAQAVPPSAPSGVTLGTFSVQLADQYGNTLSTGAPVVTLAAPGYTITGTNPQTGASGVATFSDIALTGPTGTAVLGITSPGVTGVSANVLVGAGGATTMSAKAGVALNTGYFAGASVQAADLPAVVVRDAGGNVVSGFDVIFTLTQGGDSIRVGGALFTNGQPVHVTTDANGIAAINGWYINKVQGPSVVQAGGAGLAGSPVTFTANGGPGPAAKLGIQAAPTSTSSGALLSPQPVMTITDQYGNVQGSGGFTVSVSASAGYTLGGTTTVSNVAGVATFTDLAVTGPPGTATLTYSAPTLTSRSLPVSVTAGAPAKLAFVVHPSNVAAGSVISPAIQVAIQDASGNTVNTNAPVTLAIKTGTEASGSTLSGTATVNAVSGIATFSDISLNHPGTGYQLDASSPSVATASSNPFNVTLGAAKNVAVFAGNGQTGSAGSALEMPIVATLSDGLGNTFRLGGGASVHFVIAQGGGTFDGSLVQVDVLVDAQGNASTPWHLGASGAQQVKAYVVGAGGDTATFNASLGTSVTNLVVVQQPETFHKSGALYESPVSVQLFNGEAQVHQAGVAVTATLHLSDSCGLTCANRMAKSLVARGKSVQAQAVMKIMAARVAAAKNAKSGRVHAVAPRRNPRAPMRDMEILDPQIVSGSTASTDADGLATFTDLLVAGRAYSEFYYTFTAAGIEASASSEIVTLTAGNAQRLVIDEGTNNQRAVPGTIGGWSPRVLVQDGAGNQTEGTVTFQIASGGGGVGVFTSNGEGYDETFENSTVIESSEGSADLWDWKLGPSAGTNTLTASLAVEGSDPYTVTFTAQAVFPTRIEITRQPSPTVVSDESYFPTLIGQLADAEGPIGGYDIPASVRPVKDPSTQESSVNFSSGTAIISDYDGSLYFDNIFVYGSPATTFRAEIDVSSLELSVQSDLMTMSGTPEIRSLVGYPSANKVLAPGAIGTIAVLAKDGAGNIVTGASVWFYASNGCHFSDGETYTKGSASTVTDLAGVASVSVRASNSPLSSCSVYVSDDNESATTYLTVFTNAPGYAIWIGGGDVNFNSPGAWLGNAVPSASTSVFVPYSSGTLGLGSDVSVQRMVLEGGAGVDLNGHNLTVLGDTADFSGGSVSGNGTLVFAGVDAAVAAYAPGADVVIGDMAGACGSEESSRLFGALYAKTLVLKCPLDLRGQFVSVGGAFSTQGHGALSMHTNPNDYLQVNGTAAFNGATSNVSTGLISINSGNFLANASSFIASGTNQVTISGDANGTVNLQLSPGTNQFQTLNLFSTSNLVGAGFQLNVPGNLQLTDGASLVINGSATLHDPLWGSSSHITGSGSLTLTGACPAFPGAISGPTVTNSCTGAIRAARQ